ncbi:MAG: FecR domain-containing protein [Stenomitos frigidus ULC029]
MSHRFSLIVILSLFGTGTLVLPPLASAETPLTTATVQTLRNQVQLIFKNRVTRAAQKADTMTPGDALATARQSFAELRFNDRSLARIGERALFQFVPKTRNFYLGNGTALLLIPPGQGRTNIRTPNAAAGIRGSALFVRYNEDTNTTIVGALTNSRIEVSNNENPQAQTLKAGQIAVIIQNQIVQVYNFDLNTFYQTSELVKGLDLPLRNAAPSADPGLAAVQAETAQAIKEQIPLRGQVTENPNFISLSPPSGLQTAVVLSPSDRITLTPSGLDLSIARQMIMTNPSVQAFQPSSANAQSGVVLPPIQLSIPDAANVNGAIPPSVQPIVAPSLSNPSVISGGTMPPDPTVTPSTSPTLPPPPASAPPRDTTPPQTVPSAPVAPVVVTPPTTPTPAAAIPIRLAPAPVVVTPPSNPTPVVVTPPPPPAAPMPVRPAPVVVTPPSNPTPAPQAPIQPIPAVPLATTPQTSPAPVLQPPIRPESPAPVVVTPPSNPTPAPQAPIQPIPAVPLVTAPQPSAAPALPIPVRLESPAPVVVTPLSNPTPAPPAPIVAPLPRPDPVATPSPVVVQPAPALISPAVNAPTVPTTIVTPPALATPAPTTLDVQTGTTGTSVPLPTGITGGTATPPSN